MHERKKRLLIIVTSNEIKIAFNSIGAGVAIKIICMTMITKSRLKLMVEK